MSDASGLRRLRDVLDPFARRAGLTAGIDSGLVWQRWSEIVGEDIARHAEPSSLRAGVLRVRTDSSAWATELSYMTTMMRGRVNQVVGKDVVREVRVWTSAEPVKPPEPARRKAAPPAPAKSSSDPLEAFERAHRRWLKRRQEGRS